jgi:hypothetical protein
VIARALAAVGLASLLVRVAQAQVPHRAGVDGGAFAVRYAASGAGAAEALSGVALRGAASLKLGPVRLEGWYLQGHLQPDSGTTTARDLVQGAAFLAYAPLRWLTFKGGADVRAYVAPSGTERWVLGQLRARAEGPLVGTTVRTHVEVWRALSASVNTGQGSASAQGGEVGLTLRWLRVPVWTRLTYGIDQATIGNRTETLEQFGVAFGYGAF